MGMRIKQTIPCCPRTSPFQLWLRSPRMLSGWSSQSFPLPCFRLASTELAQLLRGLAARVRRYWWWDTATILNTNPYASAPSFPKRKHSRQTASSSQVKQRYCLFPPGNRRTFGRRLIFWFWGRASDPEPELYWTISFPSGTTWRRTPESRTLRGLAACCPRQQSPELSQLASSQPGFQSVTCPKFFCFKLFFKFFTKIKTVKNVSFYYPRSLILSWSLIPLSNVLVLSVHQIPR